MPTDGIQPNNIEAEQAVIGAILSGGLSIYEKASHIIKNGNAFYNSDHRLIWQSIQSLYLSHDTIDTITVSNEVKKRPMPDLNNGMMTSYLLSLVDTCPSVSSVDRYARIVWERYIKREAVKSAKLLASTAEDNTKSITEVLYKHERYAEELRQLQPTSVDSMSDVMNNTVDHIEKQDNVIPFNIPYLDDAAGGMTRGEITVLGGRPGMGKSTLMLNITSKLIRNGYKVQLFSREMNKTELMKKIICMESDILQYDKVRKHDLNKKELKELLKVSTLISEKYDDLLLYDDIRTLQESMREVSKHKPDVVIDDYIQLIDMQGTADQRRLEVEKIMYEYKWLCKKNNCSAILISQLNRAIEQRDEPVPQMSDFAESGAIEQTAEMAAFVYYPYNTDPIVHDQYESRIIIAKSRYGTIGRHIVGYDGNKCRFYNTMAEAKDGKSEW